MEQPLENQVEQVPREESSSPENASPENVPVAEEGLSENPPQEELIEGQDDSKEDDDIANVHVEELKNNSELSTPPSPLSNYLWSAKKAWDLKAYIPQVLKNAMTSQNINWLKKYTSTYLSILWNFNFFWPQIRFISGLAVNPFQSTEGFLLNMISGLGASFTDSLTVLKSRIFLAQLGYFLDQNVQWDLDNAYHLFADAYSLLGFVASKSIESAVLGTGTSSLALVLPYLPYFTWPIMIGEGLRRAYEIPAIQDIANLPFYGKTLKPLKNFEVAYKWSEFALKEDQNMPYLICNYYESQEDLMKGAKPKEWVYAQDYGDREKPLIENVDMSYPKEAYFKGYAVLRGRWIRQTDIRDGLTYTLIRFGTIEQPHKVLQKCVNSLRHSGVLKGEVTEEDLKRIAPQAGYSDRTASYPVLFYVKHRSSLDGEESELARLLLGGEGDTEEEKYLSKFFPKPDELHSQTDRRDDWYTYGMKVIEFLHVFRLVASQGTFAVGDGEALKENFRWYKDLAYQYGVVERIYHTFRASQTLLENYYAGRSSTAKDFLYLGAEAAYLTGYLSPSDKDENEIEKNIIKYYAMASSNLGFLTASFDIDYEKFFLKTIPNAYYSQPLEVKEASLPIESIEKMEEVFVECALIDKEQNAKKFFLESQDLPRSHKPKLKEELADLLENESLFSEEKNVTVEAENQDPYLVASEHSLVKIKGRWIEIDGHYAFATQANSVKLLSACMSSLVDSGKLSLQKSSDLVLPVIFARTGKVFGQSYPVTFWFPLKGEDGGERLVLFKYKEERVEKSEN